jgi:cytochrome P450
MSPAGSVPTMSVDLASSEVNNDPFPYLNAVREEAPAVYNPAVDRWMVGRWDDLRAMLKDDQRCIQDAEFFDDIFGARLFIADQNPTHKEYRDIWADSFRHGFVQTYRDELETLVDGITGPVDVALAKGEEVDIMATLASTPALFISRMLGLEENDTDRFATWAQTMNGIAGSVVEGPTERGARMREEGLEASRAMCAFAGEQLDQRREAGRTDDLIGLLAHSPIGDEMTQAQREGHISLLTLGGHETTHKLLGQMIVLLGRNPDQRAAIAADRSLVRPAVEEILRFAGVIGAVVREAAEDLEIGEVTIPAGSQVLGLPTAANRDPGRWEDPDRFDIFREPKAHIGFGFGPHACIGMNLVRLEAEIVLNRVLDGFPDYQLVEPQIEYGRNWFVRGPVAVNITA